MAISKSFNPDGKGARKAIILACPACAAAKRYSVMEPRMVLEHGPAAEIPGEDMDTPFCVYKCGAQNCGYEEIHYYVLMRK